MKERLIKQILDQMEKVRPMGPKVRYKMAHILSIEIEEILEHYTNFLVKWSYTDADVYAEEPRAVSRFLNEK